MGNKNDNNSVIGIDLGGTKILAGVVDGEGKILGIAKRATRPHQGVEKVIERIVKTVDDALQHAHLGLEDVATAGIGTPGPLDPDAGIILRTPNMEGWENIPLGKLLSKELRVPVAVENDVNMGTLGECVYGAGKGARDVIGIFVGTGIGGGIVLDGQLRQGWRKAAAEVGHMIVLADGPTCGCGNRGCLESVASRTALERDILAGIRAGRDSLIPGILERDGKERMTSGALAEALEKGDTLVAETIFRTQYYLGLAIASLVNFLDPEIVIVGGGVTEALGEEYLKPIRRVAYQNFINKQNAKDVKIVPAKLGDNAALLGAAVWARRRLES